MNYCIVEKIENSRGELKYTPIGYTTDMNICDEINSNYNSTLGAWINDNMEGLESKAINASYYFDTNPPVYTATVESTSTDGLEEITNINQL